MDSLQKVMLTLAEKICEDGHPMENSWDFCPKCGKPVKKLTEEEKRNKFFDLATAEMTKKPQIDVRSKAKSVLSWLNGRL